MAPSSQSLGKSTRVREGQEFVCLVWSLALSTTSKKRCSFLKTYHCHMLGSRTTVEIYDRDTEGASQSCAKLLYIIISSNHLSVPAIVIYLTPSSCLLNENIYLFLQLQFSSVAQSCPTLCDPTSCSTPGLPVHHQLPEFTQTHVHRVGDAIQPSHPLSSPSPPAPNPSQHQGLFQ